MKAPFAIHLSFQIWVAAFLFWKAMETKEYQVTSWGGTILWLFSIVQWKLCKGQPCGNVCNLLAYNQSASLIQPGSQGRCSYKINWKRIITTDYLFLWLWAGGILRILQSYCFRERAVFSYLLTTVMVTNYAKRRVKLRIERAKFQFVLIVFCNGFWWKLSQWKRILLPKRRG